MATAATRQFFLSVPRDLEEAALLDGASHFYVFSRIVLPLSVTPLVTIAMLTGINVWNEFFWPYLVAKDEALQVLPVVGLVADEVQVVQPHRSPVLHDRPRGAANGGDPLGQFVAFNVRVLRM